MKQFIYILSLIISVILTSCEGLPNVGMDINDLGGNEVKINALTTRGLVDLDYSNSIGTFMYKEDGNLYNSSANFMYNLQEPSSEEIYPLSPADNSKVLYYPPIGTGTIYAYYPYVETLSGENNTKYYIDDWNGQSENESKYDLYTAKVQGSIADKNTTKTLAFDHVFSRIYFNIYVYNYFEVSSKPEISISNINRPVYYDVVKRTFDYEEINGSINMIVSDDGKSAHVIVPPDKQGESTNHELFVKYGGKTYYSNVLNNIKFESGNNYVWNIKIYDKYITVEAEMEEEILYGGVF